MDVETVANFFALLLLGAAAGTVAIAIRPPTRQLLIESVLPLSALVAVSATAGSLYFSEIAGFVPCEFCWYQRTAMYPLAVLTSIAAVRHDRSILPYTLALSAFGSALSMYHIQLQQFPDQATACELSNPCTSRWVEAFGWMTIPQMAGTSFALITVLTSLAIFAAPRETS